MFNRDTMKMKSIIVLIISVLSLNSAYCQEKFTFDKGRLHSSNNLTELKIRIDGGYKGKFIYEGPKRILVFYYFYNNGFYCNFGVVNLKKEPSSQLDKEKCKIYPNIRDDYTYWGFYNITTDSIIVNSVVQKGFKKKKYFNETQKFRIINDTTIILCNYINYKGYDKITSDTLTFFNCINKPEYSDILEKELKNIK